MDDTDDIHTSGVRGPVPEAPKRVLEQGAHMVLGPGWFVTNVGDATWWGNEHVTTAQFESPEQGFDQIVVNVRVVQPGQSSCMYHREFHEDEAFLVFDGTCTLIVEGQERQLRAGDFFHCPAGTAHSFVGTGDRPCAMVGIGGRGHLPDGEDELLYPVEESAVRLGAGVTTATTDPDVAYADSPASGLTAPGWVPGVA